MKLWVIGACHFHGFELCTISRACSVDNFETIVCDYLVGVSWLVPPGAKNISRGELCKVSTSINVSTGFYNYISKEPHQKNTQKLILSVAKKCCMHACLSFVKTLVRKVTSKLPVSYSIKIYTVGKLQSFNSPPPKKKDIYRIIYYIIIVNLSGGGQLAPFVWIPDIIASYTFYRYFKSTSMLKIIQSLCELLIGYPDQLPIISFCVAYRPVLTINH